MPGTGRNGMLTIFRTNPVYSHINPIHLTVRAMVFTEMKVMRVKIPV